MNPRLLACVTGRMELSLEDKAEAMGKYVLWGKVIPNMLSLIFKREHSSVLHSIV